MTNLRSVEEIIEELKLTCAANKYPMFVSVARKDKNGDTEYYNKCLLSEVQQPGYITRISRLLLSVNGAENHIPLNIQRSINELSDFLAEYNIALKDIQTIDTDVKVEKYHENLMVVNGLNKVKIPNNVSGDFFDGIDLDDLDDIEGLLDYEE